MSVSQMVVLLSLSPVSSERNQTVLLSFADQGVRVAAIVLTEIRPSLAYRTHRLL